MLPNFFFSAKTKRLLAGAIVSIAVAACGGGGGSPGAVPGAPVTPTVPVVTEATMTMSILNSSGTALTSISGSETALVTVKLVDGNGVGAADSLVKFTSSDSSLIKFIPETGTAKTDATGTAVITIQPTSFNASGALSIDASGTSAATSKTATASKVISVTKGPVIITEPVMTLSIVDGSGAQVTSLAGSQSAFVRATLVDASGVGAADSLVKFSVSDSSLLKFTPENGSAKTDATGTAVILVQPTSVNANGALSISVTGTSAATSRSAAASKVISVAPAPLVLGTLSFATPAPTTLPAFSTIQVNVPVTSGGQPAASVSGLTLTSLCAADGTAKLVLGSLSAGVQSATYTNTGCLRGTDTITAVLGGTSKSISLGVDAANIGTIQFVSSDSANSSIVLRGSGGLGRKESALVTFRVLDQNNSGLAGVDVSFKATTTTGGLTVLPAAGTTDAQGFVTTTVSSGTIPTPVRVIAEATRNGRLISGLSDNLTISTGLPMQKALSMSADAYNIEGLDKDGTVANITVRMGDQYGNPISDNTAVSFITEGGMVGSSAQGACSTVNGGCTVQLRSQNFRPINGRVTVLAYVQGLEDFVDMNGDGQYSCTDPVDAQGNRPAVYRPLVDTCRSGGEPFTDMPDPFLDTGSLDPTSGRPAKRDTFDGIYNPGNGDLPIPFNGTYKSTGDGKWGINYIRASSEFTFSGGFANIVRQVCTGATCRDWNFATDGLDIDKLPGMSGTGCTAGKITRVFVRVYDELNNPMPAGSSVSIADASKLTGSAFPNAVASTNAVGGTLHSIDVKAADDCAPGSLKVVVTAPSGRATAFTLISTSAPTTP